MTTPHTMSTGPAHGRKITLALLVTGAIDPNNRSIWTGVAAACRDAGVNLICYPGRLVGSPAEFEMQRNIIYRMVDPHTVDGIVLMGGVNALLNLDETYTFLQRFRPLPIVTTGIVLEHIPGVTVDNYHGMHAVVTHLVEVHGRRRIAFIRGLANHQEANDRYRAYQDVLTEHDIPFDPALVYLGNFKESGGVEGVRTLLDERKVKFDALAGASDDMAIGAIKTMQARGLHIPGDVAVVGVNAEDQGLVITPPLTTAPLHFVEQAYEATRMVLALLRGEPVPAKVILPTRLEIRQSCGCPDPLVTHAEAVPHTEKLDSFTDEIRLLDSLVFGETETHVSFPLDEPVRQVFPLLLKLFLAEAQEKGSPGEFLDLFGKTLQQTANTNDAFPRWHEIISILRQFAISQLSDSRSRLRIENLVQQARIIIGESARRHYAYRVLQADDKLHTLGEISQSLSTINSVAELTEVLERSLLLLNIPRCYLFLYEHPAGAIPSAGASASKAGALKTTGSIEDLLPALPAQARFVFAYENHRRVEIRAEWQVFPARRLLPPGLLSAERQHSLMVEPLFFREDELGYAVFETDPREEAIYEILGGQISAALKRTILTERNIRLFDEAVEARKAAEEANLLKSRFLSMVSHELRTPLALIVGTIEMMLQEEKSGGSPPLPDSYRQDMDGIHTSARHLFRLIGDVLDLASNQAGELRLTGEPLDLAALFGEAAVLGKSMAREKGLQWREQIPDHLPLVWGDRTRLRQVTLNLLSNAVKFTEHGAVSLVVSVGAQPSGGGVPLKKSDFPEKTGAGLARVWIEVGDTGMGIPLAEQAVIFDEFRRSERSVARGYGGMGLGLAITRRLIELHGGEIGVRSTGVDGTGSTFYFSLPVMANAPAGVAARASRRSTVLLLVESTPGIETAGSDWQRLQQYLQHQGFAVEVIDVARQPNWLAQVIALPPGAVVLDFQPATERGWELMQLLKQNPETRDIPVVFYSLPAGEAHWQSGERLRGSMLELDYLAKPVGSAELSEALERLGLLASAASGAGEGGVQTILVVDDDPNVLNMHVRMLESQVKCRILKAHGGQEALDILQREPLALVLLDLMMPEVDGFEVLRRMRSQELNRGVPVIVLSAQILTGRDMQRLQEGVASVLGKGLFSPAEVLAQVEASLNHSKRLGSQASRIVRQAMAYIHEHYAEPLTRTVLAGQVALTERYLTRCFREELGITPMTYLNRYRVRQAKLLLEQGALSITEVALEVGFSESSYFNRVFRQETGLSPGAYQRERK